MALPENDELMRPALELLIAQGGELTFQEVLEGLQEELALSEEDLRKRLPSGRETIFANRLDWALTYLKTFGHVDSPLPQTYRVTSAGYAAAPEQEALVTAGARLQEQDASAGGFAEPRVASLSDKAEDHDAVHDKMRAAMEQLDLVQRQELLQKICRQSPEFFERLVIDLMLAMGYARERADLTRQLGRSGDGGVDGILQEDELGLSRIYFQAKRYKPGNPVPIAAIREFAGALDSKKVHKGLFMTTSRFPKSAFKFVSSVSRHIVLIDGDELTRRMMTHEVGVKRLAVYEIKCVDEAYFADESDD